MPKRLFILDDNDDILELLKLVFLDEGFNVVIANNSDAALFIAQVHPDLILLDLRLEGSEKNGDQICWEIKHDPITQNIPVILVSAELDLESIAMACGADGFILKPFDVFDLVARIRKYLLLD